MKPSYRRSAVAQNITHFHRARNETFQPEFAKSQAPVSLLRGTMFIVGAMKLFAAVARHITYETMKTSRLKRACYDPSKPAC